MGYTSFNPRFVSMCFETQSKHLTRLKTYPFNPRFLSMTFETLPPDGDYIEEMDFQSSFCEYVL